MAYSAPVFSAHRLILLAEYGQAVEVDDSFCPRALAAAALENVQMADGRSKVISGQSPKPLTAFRSSHIVRVSSSELNMLKRPDMLILMIDFHH